MRILCITSQRASVTNVRPEAQIFIGLQQLGCTVTVMTEPDSQYLPIMQAAGITVVPLAISGKFDRRARQAISAQLPYQDIVYAFNNNAIANALGAARQATAKFVTYRGQTGNISRWDPFAYLTHLHPRVDCIVCVADAVRQSLVPHLRHPEKAVTIYKGHDLGWYNDVAPAELSSLGLSDSDIAVLCVSNYRPRKGIEALIRSFDGLPANIHLLLVGKGTDHPRLQRLARNHLEASRFHPLGYRSEVLPLTAAADIAVLPALRREGLPKSIIEAMACGIATVVTDTGGNAELVADQQTGLVVPANNSDALAAAILALASDSEKRAAMGRAGRQRIDRHFNVRETVTQTYQLFSRLLQDAV